MLNNKNQVLDTVKKDGLKLEIFNNEFKDDYDIVLEACKQNGMALKFASDRLKNNEDIVLEASKTYSGCLEYVNEDFKKNKKFCLRVCEVNGRCFNFIDKKLKNDYDIILKAIQSDSFVLSCLDEKFKQDKNLILEACKNNFNYFNYIPENIRKSSFGNDLKNAINNYSLNTFKRDFSYYFKDISDIIVDESISFNNIIKTLNKEDLNDKKIVNSLIERFSKYDCSNDFDLNRLQKYPNRFLEYLKALDFNTEELNHNLNIEIKN